MSTVEFGLEHHVRVRLQEFEEITVRYSPLLVQTVHDAVVNVGRGTLIHDFRLALRIEVLRNVPYNTQQFPLPGLQPRRGLFQKVQQIFLRQPEQLAAALDVQQRVALDRSGRNGTPQVIESTFLV